MILADWIAIGVVLVFALIGLIAGFSGGLKFFTSGIFGVIISVVVCFFLYGIVASWPFVNDLVNMLTDAVQAANNAFCDFLVKIQIGQIVLCVVMFIVVQIVRVIIVSILAGIVGIEQPFFKFINKVLGVVLFIAVAVMLGLIALQICYWIGGNTATDVGNALKDSTLGLGWVYENNPLRFIVDMFTA